MSTYYNLSEELQNRIMQDRKMHRVNPYAFCDEAVIRRESGHDVANLWRPAFVRDTEKIMHLPYYNRYADKTQVFSFYRNDDISRRAQHVQIVSRIARNIGNVLNLNQDLIEAIALGHDIGHTPFGHAGEYILSSLLEQETGRVFFHNVHSVRVLDKLAGRNISLQTLDGILCHNGEVEQQEYRPNPYDSFDVFDERVEACYQSKEANLRLVPATLEACVVRISDIIAYLGKDRQDAMRLAAIGDDIPFAEGCMGNTNAEIINNLVVNIIENSYGKPYLSMDKAYFDHLQQAKSENYHYIYDSKKVQGIMKDSLKPMFEAVYYELLKEAKSKDKNSYLYRYHIAFVEENNRYSRNFSLEEYLETEPNQLVVDYIASMTDDYFVDLYHEMFPKGPYQVSYVGYFD